MARWKGTIVFQKYYDVEVDDAKDWTDAHNQMCDICVADEEPFESDFEIYNIRCNPPFFP